MHVSTYILNGQEQKSLPIVAHGRHEKVKALTSRIEHSRAPCLEIRKILRHNELTL